MVLHQIVVEQEVEPVGVAELSLLQVSVHCSVGVRQAKLSVGSVVRINEFVHLTIKTWSRAINEVGQLQPALGSHLLIYTHLLLWVGDVVIIVAGFQPIGELTGIVERAMSCAAFLGCHNNHTGHGACTIYRGSRTILKNLEALDIIGVKTGYGIGYQRSGITRRKVVGRYIHSIFHDDTIYDPQRAGVTIYRCGTTHTNLRCRTEGTWHVLNAHTGSTTLQSTWHIGHTIEFGIVSTHLCGGTGEESLVHLLNTCYDDLTNLVSLFGVQHDLHVFATLYCFRLHSNVGNHQSRIRLRRRDAEMSVQISGRTSLRTLYHNRSADDGLSILWWSDGSWNCCLGYSHSNRKEEACQNQTKSFSHKTLKCY